MTDQEPVRHSPIQRVVGWLRAGYPDGVPQQDYVALLGILERSLTPSELTAVVDALSEDAEAGRAIITSANVRDRIEDVLKGPALAADVDRVSARLAAVGWPLGNPELEVQEPVASSSSDGREGLVTRVVEWLRKGYPTGMPDQDFVPLVALLRRRLTDAEVSAVAHDLVQLGTLPAGRVDVGSAIVKVTAELPSDDDVERVRAYLTEHGWPVDFQV